MKTSNYLLFLAIYGGLTGIMMLFNAPESLKMYGVVPADQYHVAILQYLGISNFCLALLTFLFRNDSQTKNIQNVLLVSATVNIVSTFKGCYDFYIQKIPVSSFFWGDAIFRLCVGLVTLLIFLKISKKS
jgi:heme/copper-type cytochrome/quinol oxidase subunit 4